MKKICTFTQTYSDHRSELFFFHTQDKLDTIFRNRFESNFYSFHNCSDEFFNILIKSDYIKGIKNLTPIKIDNVPYPKTLKGCLHWMKNEGFEYVIFLQDDVFTNCSLISIYDELFEFIHTADFDMLNLETTYLELKSRKPTLFENDNFVVYNTTTSDFRKNNIFSFDDGPYIARIDFLLNSIYDEQYFSHKDIWSAEYYLQRKMSKFNVQRLTLNHSIYRRFNITGKNDRCKKSYMKELLKHITNINNLSL